MKCKGNQLLVLRVLESLWLCSNRENWGKLRETSRDSSSLAPTCRFLSNPHESDVHYTTSSRENNVMDVYSGHVIFQHMVCIFEAMCSIQGNVYSSSYLGCSVTITLVTISLISCIPLSRLHSLSCRYVGQWHIKSKALHKGTFKLVFWNEKETCKVTHAVCP